MLLIGRNLLRRRSKANAILSTQVRGNKHTMADLYQTLGVPENASMKQIEQNYQRVMKTYGSKDMGYHGM